MMTEIYINVMVTGADENSCADEDDTPVVIPVMANFADENVAKDNASSDDG